MARILLVEDDPRIVSFIRRGLEAEGHVIDTADTAVRGLNMARENDYPLLILDRMLPDMDGVEICRQLRQERVDSRILMLTARDTLDDKVGGLRAGADD
jgi:DNA-binding response OmpR family regulator